MYKEITPFRVVFYITTVNLMSDKKSSVRPPTHYTKIPLIKIFNKEINWIFYSNHRSVITKGSKVMLANYSVRHDSNRLFTRTPRLYSVY